jgi:hypothetical protein
MDDVALRVLGENARTFVKKTSMYRFTWQKNEVTDDGAWRVLGKNARYFTEKLGCTYLLDRKKHKKTRGLEGRGFDSSGQVNQYISGFTLVCTYLLDKRRTNLAKPRFTGVRKNTFRITTPYTKKFTASREINYGEGIMQEGSPT